MERLARYAAGALLCTLAMTAVAAPQYGVPPPDDLGTSPRGNDVRVSDHRGKVVMVSFWASWCGVCKRQFPALDTFQQMVDKDRLEVIVVNFKEPVRDFRAVVRSTRKSPVSWTHDADGAVSAAWKVTAVPHLYIIDKQGNLAYRTIGYSEDELPDLVDVVNELLAEPDPVDAASGSGPVARADDD